MIVCSNDDPGVTLTYFTTRSNLLKTHFGLHNTLMTLSSLEIRNFGALRISYRYGACNGGD